MSTVIKTSGRNTYIDCVKRISIILVILGCTIQRLYPEWKFSVLEKGIYMFHMPLFISVSGYLFYPSITKEAITEYMSCIE